MVMGLSPVIIWGQTGHILQGIGAVNTSMGGASTAQPIDISGALQWNPAAISAFKSKTFSANAGFFFSAPELSSTFSNGSQTMSGTTKDERGMSVMPALAFVSGKEKSRHTWGVSAFGISGFGVTFPENMSNPINMPQTMGGFGTIKSDYQLMQVGLTYAYAITDQLSIGIAPTFNYAALTLAPNPLSSPSMTKGYPVADKASALGYGAQVGLYYQSPSGLKLGASYKSPQFFGAFDFTNTYLDGTAAPNVKFTMNYPAIYSLGIGYSKKLVDLALDYRMVNYENTEGFEKSGWTPTASVAGFGWKNISILSAGIQYKGISKLPLRVGYTYSSNPIQPELAFFSTPATAVIKHAFQFGFGYSFNDKFTLNTTYHHGTSGGSTSGQLLSPMMISEGDPLGKVPGSAVSYKMNTDLFLVGVTYVF